MNEATGVGAPGDLMMLCSSTRRSKVMGRAGALTGADELLARLDREVDLLERGLIGMRDAATA